MEDIELSSAPIEGQTLFSLPYQFFDKSLNPFPDSSYFSENYSDVSLLLPSHIFFNPLLTLECFERHSSSSRRFLKRGHFDRDIFSLPIHVEADQTSFASIFLLMSERSLLTSDMPELKPSKAIFQISDLYNPRVVSFLMNFDLNNISISSNQKSFGIWMFENGKRRFFCIEDISILDNLNRGLRSNRDGHGTRFLIKNIERLMFSKGGFHMLEDMDRYPIYSN